MDIKKNNIIKLTYVLTNVFIVLLIAFFIITLFILAYSFIDAKAFSNVIVNDILRAGFGLNFRVCDDCTDATNIALSQLNNITKIWLLIRSLLSFGIIFFILKTLRGVLRNMTSYKVFFEDNIHYFKLLSKLTFGLVLIGFFNINFLNDTLNWHFTIPFKTIALAFGFLVLSEIFKEGKGLLEDKNSII